MYLLTRDAPGACGIDLSMSQSSPVVWLAINWRSSIQPTFCTAAAQALEPSTQPVKISSGVLKDEAALDAWWAAKRAELITKLAQGPIQIN